MDGDRRRRLVDVAGFALVASIAAAVAVGIGVLGFDLKIRAVEWRWALGGAALLGGVVAAGRTQTAATHRMAICVCVFAVVAAANAILGLEDLVVYGDYGSMQPFLEGEIVFSRWLAVTALVGWAYAAVSGFLEMRGAASPLDAGTFVAVSGAAVMAMSSLVLARLYSHRAAALAVMAGPLWLTFASGYSEMYPFLAGAYAIAFFWLVDVPLSRREAWQVGMVAGLLMAAYVGFWPVAILVLVSFGSTSVIRGCQAVAVAVGTFFVAVRLLWPGSPASFFSDLYSNLASPYNHRVYAEFAADPAGLSFISAYALSAFHAWEVIFMVFFGAGLGLVVLCGAAGVRAIAALRSRRVLRDGRYLLALLFVAFSVRHLFFTIPKLGPRMDVDLFWNVYVGLTCLAGALLSQGSVWDVHRRRWTAAYVGAGIAGFVMLRVVGLPDP